MASYPILLEVYRGAELYDVAFELRLRSLCQKDLGTPYPIQVHFARPCPGIELAGQLSTGETKYILAEDEALLHLNARRPVRSPLATMPWVNLTHVTSARFVFKTHRSTSWTEIPVDDIRNISAAVPWDVSALPAETTLYVRAEVKCTVDGFNQQANPELFQSVPPLQRLWLIKCDQLCMWPPRQRQFRPMCPQWRLPSANQCAAAIPIHSVQLSPSLGKMHLLLLYYPPPAPPSLVDAWTM